MTFSQFIYTTAGSEFATLGLRRARPFEHADYAVYFRRENLQIGSYAIIRDARKPGRGVDCDYWFAPLDLPDDRIAFANLGWRITIYRDWAFDNRVLDGIIRRIKTVANLSETFVPVAEDELRAPSYRTRRGLMILETARIIEDLKESEDGHSAWTHLLKLVKEQRLSVYRKVPEWENLDAGVRAQCEELVAIALARDSMANKATGDLLNVLLFERAVLTIS